MRRSYVWGRALGVFVALLCLTAWGGAPTSPATALQEPEKAAAVAIWEAAQKYVDPRVTRDRKALEALFTVDADHLDADGSFRRGRDEIVKHILDKPVRCSFTPRTGIHLVGPQVALVDGHYRQRGDNREMWATMAVRWTPDGWRIAAIRILLPVAPVK